MKEIIPPRGLVVGPDWARRIVSGEKVWELRKEAVNLRGIFAVIAKGTGTIIGTVEITDCLGPLGQSTLMKNRNLACETPGEIRDDVKNGYVYAWVLANARAYRQPVRYKHPSGAVKWVTLSPDRLK